ncbi:F-box protein [Actinidia chinensis var. chinensis]|uniref:F-box protein n=1 Tax=Actinidia chinensis var. chinensis TaxID=1590841 RepID=A0A2R6QS85_ACTCC|nr:F-box protein [Actinidia chinensis var. chinensis]
METRTDFLQWLQFDMVLKILMSLDDPRDLIRASVLSRYWRHFVIANGLCKQLCLRLFPQISSVAYVTEPRCGTKESAHVGSSNNVELETFEREHRVYAFLVRALTTFTASDCVAEAISASSTDNYPEESIRNTLNRGDRVLRRASYWSSKGQRDPAVPETLIYKLIAGVCVITEISVRPFQAYFQPGKPIYSVKSVRFRMGHPRSPTDIGNDLGDLPLQLPADDKFIWTYTSQEFPMAQENSLQKFKLPEPVLCIGGFLQIELLGRVQKQEMDGLYYICVAHVEVLGQSLFPSFDVEILELSGKFVLKYYPLGQNSSPPVLPYSQLANSPNLLPENLRDLEQLLNMLNGNAPDLDPNDWDDDDNDIDLVLM